MSSGGRLDRMLDHIPGYGGYRDKERRRDSDRALRETLARDYGQLAERLQRLARRLADERQIMAVPVVDRPHDRLVAFIDRVRTASYGYAPLFSDAPVDETALDQLAAFDRALADQQAMLDEQITSLERADPKSADFKQHAAAIEEMVQGLLDRLEKRNDVITTGRAQTGPDVLALIEPQRPGGTPIAWRLHEGEALAYDDVNYTIVGRVSAESAAGGVRAFQLRGGSGDQWLVATSDPAAPLHWTRRVQLTAAPGSPTVEVAGTSYALARTIEGRGDVIGQAGSASDQPVRVVQYRATSGAGVLDVFDWSSGNLALAGTEVDAPQVELFTREK